jgi:hypothetical protein
MANNQIEATGNKLCGFSEAGCPCASFISLDAANKLTALIGIIGSFILHQEVIYGQQRSSNANSPESNGQIPHGRSYTR